jgi:signal peptidase I
MDVKGILTRNRGSLAVILVLLAFRWSFADHYRVPTGSMLPTIQLGDDILTNKMAYDFKLPFTELSISRTGEPQRGDIIVFLFPKNESINFVKRVVGVPGDTVLIENTETIVPPDMYYVMGDNRDNSLDSRYWGFVPRKNIKGRALAVLWNINFARAGTRLN